MIKIKVLILAILIVPTFIVGSVDVLAQFGDRPLVPDCDIDCGFNDFMTLLQNVVDYLILIAAPIAAVVFTIAGFKYMTAAGDTGKISEAHEMFKKVLIGFIFILSAYLIVNFILQGLGVPSAFNFFD